MMTCSESKQCLTKQQSSNGVFEQGFPIANGKEKGVYALTKSIV